MSLAQDIKRLQSITSMLNQYDCILGHMYEDLGNLLSEILDNNVSKDEIINIIQSTLNKLEEV